MVKNEVNRKIKIILGLIIILSVICWIILTESPFQKGGMEPGGYSKIILFNIILSPLIAMLFGKNNTAVRIIVGLVISTIALVIATIITMNLIEGIYNGKTWFLWENKHRIIGNSIYYGIIVAVNILLWKLYLQLKKQLVN